MFGWLWPLVLDPLGFGSTVVVVPPDEPGLEFTLPENRLHFTMPENLLGYALPANRLHYTIPGEQ